MKAYYLGIDIGGTSVKLGLFGGSAEIIQKWEISTRIENNGAYILPDVVSSVSEHLSWRGANFRSVAGIGVGVPGPVKNESFVTRCVNLGWENINIRDELYSLTGVEKITAINDAKAAALGEWWKGGHGQIGSAVMITLGTGIGGGVIINGRVYNGAFGSAGELSHFPIAPDETEECACGKFGHLQQYASADGIVHQFRKRLFQTETPSLLREDQHFTAKDILDAAKNGDELALEVVHDAVRKIAQTMAMITTVIDPELYLIGGGLSKAGDFLLDAIRAEFYKIVFFASIKAKVEPAVLGNDAGMYGAVKSVMDMNRAGSDEN